MRLAQSSVCAVTRLRAQISAGTIEFANRVSFLDEQTGAMRGLLSTIRFIRPQIVLAYLALAAVLFVVVTAAVLGGHAFVRANTIPIGELRTGRIYVDGGGAHSVDAEIIPAVGEMTLRGGAEELAELDFTTNLVEDPQMVYLVDDGLGDLLVEPSNLRGIPDTRQQSGYRNEWELRLSSETPMDLEVILGAGKGDLDLRGMALNSLTIEIGAGEALVDLRGDWAKGFHTEVDAGAGKVTLLLPDDVGVRARVERAIGAVNVSGLEKVDNFYVNTAYDGSGVTLDIEIAVAVGEANVVVLDEAAKWREAEDGQETQ